MNEKVGCGCVDAPQAWMASWKLPLSTSIGSWVNVTLRGVTLMPNLVSWSAALVADADQSANSAGYAISYSAFLPSGVCQALPLFFQPACCSRSAAFCWLYSYRFSFAWSAEEIQSATRLSEKPAMNFTPLPESASATVPLSSRLMAYAMAWRARLSANSLSLSRLKSSAGPL